MKNQKQNSEDELSAIVTSLQNSNEHLRAMADAIPIHLLEMDHNEKIIFVNKAAAEWWGYTKEEMVGKFIKEIIGEAAQSTLHDFSQRVLQGETVAYESPFLRDGNVHYFYNTYTPVRNSEGKVTGFIATGTEITERVRIQKIMKEGV